MVSVLSADLKVSGNDARIAKEVEPLVQQVGEAETDRT
jgi:hypothetical protein